jgi:SAM-dependent methyltransferase
MDKNSLKAMLDNTLMIWADCSKNILNAEAGMDDLSKYYLQLLYNIIPKSSVKNAKLKNFHGLGNEFDMVVSNFAIHYFFENSETLDNVARNISNSLKSGGKFVATTLNGEKVFNALQYTNSISNNNNSSNNNNNDNEDLLWKITKKYDQELFYQNEKGLGMRVEVYVESIGQSLDEFLVHPSYFEQIMSNYGLKLVETLHFEDIFKKVVESNISYGKMLQIDEDAKTYSFMNVAMVFEKE